MLNSDSSNAIVIRSFLEERGVYFISDIKGDRPPPVDFAIFISEDQIAEHAAKDVTSLRQMHYLEGEIKTHLGLNVEWITTPSEKAAVLEAALLELLEARYPGSTASVIISSPNRAPVSVWVEPKATEGGPLLVAVETLIKDFLGLYGIANPVLLRPETKNLPSKPIILRALKTHAPTSTEGLVKILRTADLNVPHSHWLQTKLDALRKQGLVIRSKTGDYSLTELGLQVVPHGRHRSSSDVERALAFGRRQW